MTSETRDANWRLRIGLAVLLLAFGTIAYFLSVNLVPRMWAQWLGNRIDGRLTVGTGYGLLFGFVFTLLPLAIGRQAVRLGLSWAMRVVLVVLAVIVAVPNLMTLGIVWGTSNAAHAGERILDVDGPAFRGSSALGAGAAVLSMLLVWGVRALGGRESRELTRARKALADEKS